MSTYRRALAALCLSLSALVAAGLATQADGARPTVAAGAATTTPTQPLPAGEIDWP
ncbi:hypothetical protein [Kitasatospora aureofaciens]|uniref:hypothetical protein n=1 Tax=Kitasatospora aureofaciens TaxID=1894 RepID=UPI001C45B60D|nr:hypothetical protein [Kitasatospora aureofaciens]MBV6699797.1 hypothetical protein [Kitasatospora aureofaciens]